MIASDDTRIELLLFSVGGVHFGVDVDQVAGIEGYEGDQADCPVWFHEELEFGVESAAYASPMVATVRTAGVQPYRVIIDSMEDIASFRVRDIQLFPDLLGLWPLQRGLWGVLPLRGRLILLVDFYLLLKKRRATMSAVVPEQDSDL